MGLGGMQGARSRVRLCHNSSAAPATLQPGPQGPTQPPHHPPSQHCHHGHGRASSSHEDTLARGRNRQHRFALVPDDTGGPRSLRLVWAKLAPAPAHPPRPVVPPQPSPSPKQRRHNGTGWPGRQQPRNSRCRWRCRLHPQRHGQPLHIERSRPGQSSPGPVLVSLNQGRRWISPSEGLQKPWQAAQAGPAAWTGCVLPLEASLAAAAAAPHVHRPRQKPALTLTSHMTRASPSSSTS